MEQGVAVGMIDWKMVQRWRQWRARRCLAGARASQGEEMSKRESRWAHRGDVEAFPGQTSGACTSVWPPDGEHGLTMVGHHRPALTRIMPFQND